MLIDWNREGEDRPWKLGHKADTPRVWKGLLLTQMGPLCQLEKDSPFSLLTQLLSRANCLVSRAWTGFQVPPLSQVPLYKGQTALPWRVPMLVSLLLLVPTGNTNQVDSSLPSFWANAQCVHRKSWPKVKTTGLEKSFNHQ